MKRIILLFVCVLPLVQGCAELEHRSQKSKNISEQKTVNILLSCLNELQDIGPDEFGTNFGMAEERLQHGRNEDTLYFICLSLSPKADYQKFKQGMDVFEQYLAEQPDSPGDVQGLKILVDRLDEEIINK